MLCVVPSMFLPPKSEKRVHGNSPCKKKRKKKEKRKKKKEKKEIKNSLMFGLNYTRSIRIPKTYKKIPPALSFGRNSVKKVASTTFRPLGDVFCDENAVSVDSCFDGSCVYLISLFLIEEQWKDVITKIYISSVLNLEIKLGF